MEEIRMSILEKKETQIQRTYSPKTSGDNRK